MAAGNVGLACLLVAAAGAASSAGAGVVFATRACTPRAVACSLGFAAGVMLYVVFTEIMMVDCVGSFKKAGHSDASAYRLATVCLFVGVALTAALDALVHWIMRLGAGGAPSHAPLAPQRLGATAPGGDVGAEPESPNSASSMLAFELDAERGADGGFKWSSSAGSGGGGGAALPPEGQQHFAARSSVPAGAAEVVAVLQSDGHTQDLLRMGAVTGVAIALHNLPEGVATFVGAMSSTKVGAALATAIAIHNIPEGLCVAMPIYYATGSRWKGFMWGSLTGMAEPLGGALGYLLVHGESPQAFGIVFGLVSGMMIFVSVHELLPCAFRLDPHSSSVSASVLLGCFVMAVSLVLFTF